MGKKTVWTPSMIFLLGWGGNRYWEGLKVRKLSGHSWVWIALLPPFNLFLLIDWKILDKGRRISFTTSQAWIHSLSINIVPGTTCWCIEVQPSTILMLNLSEISGDCWPRVSQVGNLGRDFHHTRGFWWDLTKDTYLILFSF